MKKKIVIFFLYIFFIQSSQADIKDKIISNLEKTNNLTFDFRQNINNKTEIGNCAIKYPKKIYCIYKNLNKKLMVSNGRSLVIKNKNINQYYVYPINRTPLNLILDKKYLIDRIKDLDSRIIENQYINFTLINDKYEINIFFDIESLNLIGWQTEDIYQNLVITFISNVRLNQKINEDIFKLPERN